MWFCEFLSKWTSDDFLFPTLSDEFLMSIDIPNLKMTEFGLFNDDNPEELKI